HPADELRDVGVDSDQGLRKTTGQGSSGPTLPGLDELHTYRGRQGADVALLVRRAREFFGATQLQVVGTSATLAGPGTTTSSKLKLLKLRPFCSETRSLRPM